ncbi:putative phosphoribose diphosphate:decaprenyl-phosphate phosphoribosyltransferase [Actinacidiphila reveromycinica]|uniref:Putative phosphoribose diphosphate:decaprenyl-phosphate phosphoribosyltransferase n=1 Tax=Actinacidiphila reveromycinica TaxID=659352 RepID=A0A7U3UXT4_9ACTN|nr:decaprenyl-phosphate phosphoribosyltransferase [Streptomyces sp. SN-593]BBB02241.1 putative phosphoribose diphosphate:decaprenyl-phosphate phosphoribosyltransferase [Streptomyces sp. SN-593]
MAEPRTTAALDHPARPGQRFVRNSPLTGLLRTARPRQWVKNVLVLAAPTAAGRTFSTGVLLHLVETFALFCVASSAVYLVNDAQDVEADRAHPTKRHRPVAAGRVPVPLAYGAGGALAAAAPLATALLCNAPTALVLAAYVVMQLLYCFRLKHVQVVDLVVVTTGFLMRAAIGGPATGVPLSRWFLITTGFGALLMVSAKRYSELTALRGDAARSRALLASYTAGYLRFVWQLAAAVAVLSYCLWALEAPPALPRDTLLWRQLSIIPFVLGVLRYAMFADRGEAGAPEDVVLRDRPLLVTAAVWAALYGLTLARI